jgi:hypothetical protein
MRVGYQKKRIAPFIIARAKSCLIDHGLIFSFSIFTHLNFFIFYNEYVHQDLIMNWDGFFTALKINLSFFYLFYFFTMNYIFQGKTIGQQIVGIGSINNSNFSLKQISAWSSIQRSCANYICFKLGFFLFLIPLINKNNLSLADYISKTHQSYCYYSVKNKIAA